MHDDDIIEVPAREGRAVHVPADGAVRVVDVEGGQVGDLFAFVTDDPAERLSAEHTRAARGRLFPLPGEAFVTNRRRPILVLERDDSPGVHDMLIAACDPQRYADLGAREWHASCAENLRTAMAAVGVDDVGVPQPVNLFMNIPIAGDGTLGWEPAPTAAGSAVTLRAVLDCWVVVSACPQDLVPINGGGPTGLRIERLAGGT